MTARSSDVHRRWLPFLGTKLGLAKALYSLSRDPDDFDLYNVSPIATSFGRLLGYEQELNPRAGGAGTRLADAVNAAMGELLERYAAFAYDGADRILLSYSELLERGRRPVPFETLTHFSREQCRSKGFAYGEFTEATRIGWVKGTDLLDGSPTYVPGQLVSLGYVHSSDEMPPCFYSTSSGCALATSVEEALLKGILESIERDAVMIRWYARLPPPVLDLDPADLLGPSRRLQKQGLEIRFHDLAIDGDLPVVGATVVERTGRSCFFILSAASALDLRVAARKALIEAGQGRPFVKLIVATMEASTRGAEFKDFDSNIRFYAEPSNAQYVEWFSQNTNLSARKFPDAPDAKNVGECLRDLLDRCVAMGITPVAFDLTTPEILDAGLFACRVFVPELVPLCVPSAPFFGHPRLARFIACQESEGTGVEIPDWVPHPFP
jgi:ribosomal protein S12 methylthiotransferase accessory factor